MKWVAPFKIRGICSYNGAGCWQMEHHCDRLRVNLYLKSGFPVTGQTHCTVPWSTTCTSQRAALGLCKFFLHKVRLIKTCFKYSRMSCVKCSAALIKSLVLWRAARKAIWQPQAASLIRRLRLPCHYPGTEGFASAHAMHWLCCQVLANDLVLPWWSQQQSFI